MNGLILISAVVSWCLIDDVIMARMPASPCLEEMDPGYGDNWSDRYYYDRKKKQCIRFTYGGKGGTANNFESKVACERECFVSHPKLNTMGSIPSFG
ncbi:Kunitz-type conkunitzin-S1 like protein [Argiope bruennichi]|uniref:Kunitz-type conkunitzin-S1 like protein n=1 Tax=Argiope bruennichi TaxID=94029 RepID=A0A8T0E3H5_ARGBR|nr:Kunitz-type conkunitzin-S1 like protein [Argiope bruennichi]